MRRLRMPRRLRQSHRTEPIRALLLPRYAEHIGRPPRQEKRTRTSEIGQLFGSGVRSVSRSDRPVVRVDSKGEGGVGAIDGDVGVEVVGPFMPSCIWRGKVSGVDSPGPRMVPVSWRGPGQQPSMMEACGSPRVTVRSLMLVMVHWGTTVTSLGRAHGHFAAVCFEPGDGRRPGGVDVRLIHEPTHGSGLGGLAARSMKRRPTRAKNATVPAFPRRAARLGRRLLGSNPKLDPEDCQISCFGTARDTSFPSSSREPKKNSF